MDTFVVLYALVFSAAFMSVLSICLRAVFGAMTGDARGPSHADVRLRVIDPFEPTDTSFMHFDPRMAQNGRAS